MVVYSLVTNLLFLSGHLLLLSSHLLVFSGHLRLLSGHLLLLSGHLLLLSSHLLILSSQSLVFPGHLLLHSGCLLLLSGQSLLNLPGSLHLLLQLLLYLCDVVATITILHYNSIVSHREGTINATPPPADESQLDPLVQYSSILTASAGTLPCLLRLLPLISYPPPTSHHLPAGLHVREELLCLQYTCTTACPVSVTIAAVLHGQCIDSTHSIQ